ncbi:MAG: ferritin family protein [Planctomycetes bacterium]|nr:ferritin family protein [Planctomycetota bacterium]
MENFNSFGEIINYAIDREIEANKFYLDLAKGINNPILRKIFESFAKEELVHKAKLEAMKNGKEFLPAKRIGSLKIADYFVEGRPDSNMCYKEAFDLAARKETAAIQFYSDLSKLVEDESQKEVFFLLAQEEARHKLYFETAYDDFMLEGEFKNH